MLAKHGKEKPAYRTKSVRTDKYLDGNPPSGLLYKLEDAQSYSQYLRWFSTLISIKEHICSI